MAACSDKSDAPGVVAHESCEEADVATSNWHCGVCDRACGEHEQCTFGNCDCAPGWLDCDHDGSCESHGECSCVGVDVFTSHDHCGYCGHACDKNAVCESGRCKCRGNWNDCDGDEICETNGECPRPQTTSCEGADLKTSNEHCGKCDHACVRATCQNGSCVCEPGRSDCDMNGTCETEGACECRIGEKRDCFDSPKGLVYERRDANGTITAHSRCRRGHNNCVVDEDFGAYWSTMCYGAIYPTLFYTCDDPTLDMDCDGVPESQQDDDKDGHTICKDGQIDDCCDNPSMCPTVYSTDLGFVHSGMEDCIGNKFDDNCNGEVDEGPKTCENGIPAVCDLNSTCGAASEYAYPAEPSKKALSESAKAIARAMDICLEYGVTERSKKSGVIAYSLTQSAPISGDPSHEKLLYGDQANVMASMQNAAGAKVIEPRAGSTFAVLSTGEATDAMHRKQNGMREYGDSNGTVPSLYLAAHDNSLQTHAQCIASSDIHDTVHLHLRMRAPDTAHGLSFDFRFYTQEYPDFLCANWNDIFLAILTDELGNPFIDIDKDGQVSDEDGNISFDSHNNPISVNSAFFTTCTPLPCIQGYNAETQSSYYHCGTRGKNLTCNPETMLCNTCPDGTEELYAFTASPYTGNQDGDGGATAWLTTTAPIEPGQVFNLDFYLWDTGDHRFDSTVVLDNFQWLCNETTVGTGFARQHEVVN